ncbi:MAG TPA: PIG-L deacetylase family protein [Streptosporangiaceae bacterium]
MEHQVLVIAPHPDDEVLGCGGSIAKLTAAGARVQVGYLTSGEQGSGEIPADELGLLREREARAAVSVLGVDPDEVSFLRIGDGTIDPHGLVQVEAVIRLVRQVRPALVYLPHEHDGSFDHQAAHHLAVRALDMAGSRNFAHLGGPHWVPAVLGYEVWSPISRPAYLEDIGDFTAARVAALGCYSSQAGKGAGQAAHVGPAGLALAAHRGAVTAGGHREAFSVLRIGQVLP